MLFRLIGSVSSSFNSLSFPAWIERIHSSLSNSELQQKLKKGFPSTIKLKQCFRFLVSNFSTASMSTKNIRPSAVLPRFSSSSFLKIQSNCLLSTTNLVRHCLRRLVFLWRNPSLRTLLLVLMLACPAMVLFRDAIYLIQTQQCNVKNAAHFGNHTPERIIYATESSGQNILEWLNIHASNKVMWLPGGERAIFILRTFKHIRKLMTIYAHFTSV